MKLSEFYRLVISIPNYEVYVLEHFVSGYNQFLAEIYSVYCSVAYNSGRLYSKGDTFAISLLIVRHIFTKLIKTPPPKNYDYYSFWKSIDDNLSIPYTIPLVFINGK